MRRYTYQDIVLQRHRTHKLKKNSTNSKIISEISSDIKSFIQQYGDVSELVIYKIMLTKYTDVEPLTILTVLHQIINK